MMLRSVVLFVSLCVALPAQVADDIRVGSWNIEFLGADPKYRRDTPPRGEEAVQAIGKKITELGFSVLGVQEICGEDVLKEVARGAGRSWRAVLGTTGQWSDGKTQQGVGFLYDSDVVTLMHAEELLDFPSELDGVSVFHRKPVTACFRHVQTGSDFRLVVVHLKAGRKARDLKKRKAEATHLRAWIAGLLADPREDRDIVILGDFNSTYGTDPEVMLETGGLMTYLEQPEPGPTIMHFDDPIDQFCVSTEFREVQRNSMVSHHVVGDPQRLLCRRTNSDHFPVSMRMTPLADDDPSATFASGPASQVLPTTRRTNAARLPPPAEASWPPKKDAPVIVWTKNERLLGRIISVPKERGWVVLKTADGIVSVNMEHVTRIQVLDPKRDK